MAKRTNKGVKGLKLVAVPEVVVRDTGSTEEAVPEKVVREAAELKQMIEVTDLAKQAKKALRRFKFVFKKSLESYIEAGMYLAQANEILVKGRAWTAWLAKHKIAKATASEAINLYRFDKANPGKLAEVTSITEAKKMAGIVNRGIEDVAENRRRIRIEVETVKARDAREAAEPQDRVHCIANPHLTYRTGQLSG